MKLRWHQTYDKNGVKSEKTLQFREEYVGEDGYIIYDEWEDVEIVCERDWSDIRNPGTN